MSSVSIIHTFSKGKNHDSTQTDYQNGRSSGSERTVYKHECSTVFYPQVPDLCACELEHLDACHHALDEKS
jgi:hypothetical protein